MLTLKEKNHWDTPRTEEQTSAYLLMDCSNLKHHKQKMWILPVETCFEQDFMLFFYGIMFPPINHSTITCFSSFFTLR